MLRAYRDGDEQKIELTDEGKVFYNKEEDYYKYHMKNDETYTCIDSKGKVCGVMCFSWVGDITYKAWILFDKVRGYKCLRDFKKLVDLYKKNGYIGYTISPISEKQSKMHRFFNCEADEIQGDMQVWVTY